MKDWRKIRRGPIIVAVVLGLFSWGFWKYSKAADWPFPEPPFAYLGVQWEESPTFCAFNQNPDWVANTGVGQVLWKNDYVDLTALYTHHSCAFSDDRDEYDGVGVEVKWYPWKGGRDFK